MKARLLRTLIMQTIILCTLPALAEEYNGTCGNSATWNLDTESGLLKIEGSGEMEDYMLISNVPWHSYSSYVMQAEIAHGITSIGRSAFYKVPVSSGTLYVPETSIDAYRKAEYWKDWKTIKAVEEADGVKTLSPAPGTSREAYDLNGRRVKDARSGLYIQNGRKVMRKYAEFGTDRMSPWHAICT